MYIRSFPAAKVFFAFQEFGTYNPLRVVEALRTENRWHHYGDGDINHPAKTALLEMFTPMNPQWRELVLTRGREVIHQAVDLAIDDARNHVRDIRTVSAASGGIGKKSDSVKPFNMDERNTS